MKQLILASTSPRRKEILGLTGLTFDILAPSCREDLVPVTDPQTYVQELSLIKCDAALELVAPLYDEALIITADTIVCHDERILGKPKDEEEAFDMLRSLSGAVHSVYTGVTVADLKTGERNTFFEKTDVTFYDLTDQEILEYIRTGEPMDKAGAYGIQGRGACLVREIHGDYFNVVGLPVAKLYRVLKSQFIHQIS